jgi:hypothetical protein
MIRCQLHSFFIKEHTPEFLWRNRRNRSLFFAVKEHNVLSNFIFIRQ